MAGEAHPLIGDIVSTAAQSLPDSRSVILTIVDLFHSPLRAFSSIRERPVWWPTSLIAALYCLASTYFVIWRLGFERIISDAIDAAGVLDSRGYLANALENQTKILVIQGISALLGTFATILVIAVILWLALLLANSQATFKQTLAIVSSVTFVVYFVKYSLISLVAAISPGGFNINNPLATNVSFFLSSDTLAVERIYQAIDLLALGAVLLTARGLQIISGRLSFRLVLGIVGGLWISYSAVKVWAPWQ